MLHGAWCFTSCPGANREEPCVPAANADELAATSTDISPVSRMVLIMARLLKSTSGNAVRVPPVPAAARRNRLSTVVPYAVAQFREPGATRSPMLQDRRRAQRHAVACAAKIKFDAAPPSDCI